MLTLLPEFLYHYYEKARGPFFSLSDLAPEQAESVLESIRLRGDVFASRRTADYWTNRQELESRIRRLFITKGGQPLRDHPHYMILGVCAWLLEWYRQGCEVHFSLALMNPLAVSFTYGDSFPAMRFQDGRPYRGQVYTLAELPALVEQYGLPQEWNQDGHLGPERYIEAQVWDDTPLDMLKAKPPEC